jgi:hypothetical protein
VNGEALAHWGLLLQKKKRRKKHHHNVITVHSKAFSKNKLKHFVIAVCVY